MIPTTLSLLITIIKITVDFTSVCFSSYTFGINMIDVYNSLRTEKTATRQNASDNKDKVDTAIY